MQQARRWQFVTACDSRQSRSWFALGVGAIGNFDFDVIFRRRRRYSLWRRRNGVRAVLGHHAFDTRARTGRSGLHSRNFPRRLLIEYPRDFLMCILGTDRRRSRGHKLCRDRWLFRAPLFQFLLLTLALALVLPVFKAIPEREDESEARRRPQFNRGERKSSGEIERNRKHRGADNVS